MGDNSHVGDAAATKCSPREHNIGVFAVRNSAKCLFHRLEPIADVARHPIGRPMEVKTVRPALIAAMKACAMKRAFRVSCCRFASASSPSALDWRHPARTAIGVIYAGTELPALFRGSVPAQFDE